MPWPLKRSARPILTCRSASCLMRHRKKSRHPTLHQITSMPWSQMSQTGNCSHARTISYPHHAGAARQSHRLPNLQFQMPDGCEDRIGSHVSKASHPQSRTCARRSHLHKDGTVQLHTDHWHMVSYQRSARRSCRHHGEARLQIVSHWGCTQHASQSCQQHPCRGGSARWRSQQLGDRLQVQTSSLLKRSQTWNGRPSPGSHPMAGWSRSGSRHSKSKSCVGHKPAAIGIRLAIPPSVS